MTKPPEASSLVPAAVLPDVPRERIARAREIIGPGAPDDYVLRPSEHAAHYEGAAPELAELLRSAEVEIAARRYEERDAMAVQAQARFRQVSDRARVAIFVAAIAAAVILASGALAAGTGLIEAAAPVLFIAFSITGAGAGTLATVWIRQIRDGKLLEAWMISRANAETERLRYFERIANGRRLEEPLLQLEYFRRYQLDLQRAFYAGRGKQHRGEADRALARTSMGMGLAGIASGTAGILAAALRRPEWAGLAAIGLLGQAFANAVENGEATAQHRRNAERYHRTSDALDHIYAMLDRVRTAVAAGRQDVLSTYVQSVHEQISVEHREWRKDTASASEVFARLEEQLDSHLRDVRGSD